MYSTSVYKDVPLARMSRIVPSTYCWTMNLYHNVFFHLIFSKKTSHSEQKNVGTEFSELCKKKKASITKLRENNNKKMTQRGGEFKKKVNHSIKQRKRKEKFFFLDQNLYQTLERFFSKPKN